MTKTILTLALDDHAALDIIAGGLPGSHILNKTEVNGDNPVFDLAEEENNAELPLDSDRAEALMDRDGFVTVILLLDQDNYLGYVVASATKGATTPEDYAHDTAFSFGIPNDCSAEIIGVSGSNFIVSYTTHIREQLIN